MVVQTALSLVVDAALGAWLGTMVFFSFVGAPTAFRTLDEADAGAYVNATFPKYYVFGVVLGDIALVAGGALIAVTAADAARLVALAGTLVGVAIFAYSRWVLVPKMEAAGDAAFEQYHQQSVVLNGVAMLAVAAALVGSHL